MHSMLHACSRPLVTAGLTLALFAFAGCRSVNYSVHASNISSETVSLKLLRNADKPDETPQAGVVMGPGGTFEWAGPIRRGRNATVAIRRYDGGREIGDRAFIVLVADAHVAAQIDVEDGQVVTRNWESHPTGP